ncbi:MAG TPA: DUF4091 domain-containing protein [Candidatus Ratteibacteria bacterium]|nr:DUF4091 domain-containing protein [Candidatus Ratteibacteria bacterium]
MLRKISMFCLILFFTTTLHAVTVTRGPYSRIDPATKQEITPDPDAIWMENEHLKLAIITAAPHSGQIFSLIYKPTGQELCNPMTLQGYWQDRGIPGVVIEGKGEIISKSDESAVVRITYTTKGKQENQDVLIKHTKTYTLKKGASYILVDWKQENIGTDRVLYNPWIKQVGGCSSELLQGPPRILMPQGLVDLTWDMEPSVNWVVRLSGLKDSELVPMVISFTDYKHIFRQNAWVRAPRYTLETTLTRYDLKPGDAIEIPSALLITANLANVCYASPELAASLDIGEIKVNQSTTFTVNIAAGLDLDEKRLEGEIVTSTGGTVAKLPNQQVQLKTGKISKISYTFTPPKDDVYYINLTMFDRQTPIKLGEVVKSQKTYISLPVVVGQKPEVVVQKWESEEKEFPGRREREVKPYRTLINNSQLKVAQVQVPERIFPEDKLLFNGKIQPASIRMAAGEYECLQFIVEVPEKTDPMSVGINISSIKNNQGITLGKVQVREQIYLTTEIPSDYRDFPVGQWPDPLFEIDWPSKIPDAPITKKNIEVIKKCHKRVYWLIVHSQSDARPGIYKGEVMITLNGKTTGRFPVEIRVNAFSLPKHAYLRCCTGMVGWRGSNPSNWQILGLPEEEIKNITKNAMDSYRRLILEYGWTPTMWFGDWKTWEQYKDVGRGPSVFPGSGKQNEEWLIKNGLLKYAFIYAPFDEHTDGKVPEVVEWAKKWKAENKIPILDCYYGSNVKPLFGLVDIWLGQSPLSSWWGNPTPPLGWGHLAVERKKAGDQFFSCNASLQWHVEFNPAQGRSEFWNDFATGMDGRYVYSTCRWTDDVYKKNWTTGNYMGCVVYPGPYGITTSIRMETMRDAVDDFDYLSILKETVVKAETSGKVKAEVIAEAKSIIGDPKIAGKVNTVEKINEMRDKIADLIEKLMK